MSSIASMRRCLQAAGCTSAARRRIRLMSKSLSCRGIPFSSAASSILSSSRSRSSRIRSSGISSRRVIGIAGAGHLGAPQRYQKRWLDRRCQVKAQYVGDIGDFGKVLLLRHLAGSGLRIGVNWGLTPNDENADGKHRDYAGYRGRDCLCCCDEEVFKRILPTAQRNREDCELTHLEVLIRELCGTVTFFSEIFSSGHARSALDRRAFDLLNPAAAELVFFDPDNGIDLNAGSSAKYVYLSELKRYWSRGQSVLIYHHLSRTGS